MKAELGWTGSRTKLNDLELGHNRVSSVDEHINEDIVADLGEGSGLGTGTDGNSEMEDGEIRGAELFTGQASYDENIYIEKMQVEKTTEVWRVRRKKKVCG